MEEDLIALFENANSEITRIAQKVFNGSRISIEEGEYLFTHAEIGELGILANYINEKKYQGKVFYNRNFHIEPTNICVFDCKFCAYSRLYKHREEGWELTVEQMLERVKNYDSIPITEVHIVGGVHPKMDIDFFCSLIQKIKIHRPDIHIKGFTAVELDYMFRKAKITAKEGLQKLKDAGLQSLPGGGAEIFNETVRKQICDDKVDAKGWLGIHKTAHQLGMHTNATMLYGHIETYAHRMEHMNLLRELQDETNGFNCFIPLKFRNQDNQLSHIPEVTLIEDIKMYAVARIFMDNIPHLKAYWPMLGRNKAQLMLSYGVDDLDGTIDDSTKIYSMAGSEEQSPTLTTEELCNLITEANKIPVERDSLYHIIDKEMA